MPENTVSTPAAVEPGTETVAAKTPTQPTSETVGHGAEDRIAGLVAERERLKQKLESEQTARTALEEKYKTDEEKRLDELVRQRVESEYGPYKQRLERIEAELTTKRDKMLEALPEDARNCYDDSAPVEVQVRQIELVTTHLSTPNTAASRVDSGGNPPAAPPKDTRQYSRAEYHEVQRLATSNPDEFDKRWPDMKRALMDGRIEGVKPGSIITR